MQPYTTSYGSILPPCVWARAAVIAGGGARYTSYWVRAPGLEGKYVFLGPQIGSILGATIHGYTPMRLPGIGDPAATIRAEA